MPSQLLPSTAPARPDRTGRGSPRPVGAKAFGRDARGAAAVEFALVSVLFILGLMFTLSLGIILFLQQQLDRAANVAARQVMNGTVQKASYSAADFRTQVVCATLPAIFSCDDTIVNLWTATKATSPGGYHSFVKSGATGLVVPELSNSVAQYSAGVQGSYEYLQVVYPITFLPGFVTSLIGQQTYNGTPAFLAVSTAAFRNEQY